MSLRRRFPFTPLAHNVHYSKLRNNVHYCTNLNNVHYAKVMFTFRLSIVYARFLVTPFTLTHYVLVETKSTCYLSIYLSILVTAIYLPAHLPLQYPYMLCTGLKNNTKYKIPAPFGSCPVWIDIMARLRSSKSSVDNFYASVVLQFCDLHLMIALLKQSLPCIWFNINRKSARMNCFKDSLLYSLKHSR